MTHEEASKKYGLPIGFFRDCQRRGIIGKTIALHQEHAFAELGKAWCNPQYVRLQYWALTPAQRKKVVEEEPMTKIERAIYNRYLHLKEGERLTSEQMASEICHAMHVRMGMSLFDKIEKMKAKALAKRKYLRRVRAKEDED